MITVPNFRDVAASFVRDATRITPGRLYRSATPWLASAEDISYMTDELGIKLILDLRTATEQRQGDAAGESKGVLARMCTLSGHNGNDDSMRCVRAPLLNEDRFARIMFRRARFTTKLAMLTVAVGLYQPEDWGEKIFNVVNSLGLLGMYKVTIEDSAKEIGQCARF